MILGEICAIRATNRNVLIDTINEYILFHRGILRSETYLRVSLSGDELGCPGCSVEYKTEADVPEHSVPCPCGNPKHWLIRYERT